MQQIKYTPTFDFGLIGNVPAVTVRPFSAKQLKAEADEEMQINRIVPVVTVRTFFVKQMKADANEEMQINRNK